LVTAGPTVEPLDPVRFISNRSSGKMGFALAQAALNRGAEVTLITGPVRMTAPAGVRVLPVRTALEMRRQVLRLFPKAQVVIMAAAVADYRPLHVSREKIKKSSGKLNVRLVRNPDILGEILQKKKKGQVVMGFAAETGRLQANAMEKWKKKPCDLLAANQVGIENAGFEADQNELLVFSRKLPKPLLLRKDYKSRLAEKLMDLVDDFLIQ
jgi:phosphopantothenoylcysteine decarboxylase / phosphopantothenate---cysteine ligase